MLNNEYPLDGSVSDDDKKKKKPEVQDDSIIDLDQIDMSASTIDLDGIDLNKKQPVQKVRKAVPRQQQISVSVDPTVGMDETQKQKYYDDIHNQFLSSQKEVRQAKADGTYDPTKFGEIEKRNSNYRSIMRQGMIAPQGVDKDGNPIKSATQKFTEIYKQEPAEGLVGQTDTVQRLKSAGLDSRMMSPEANDKGLITGFSSKALMDASKFRGLRGGDVRIAAQEEFARMSGFTENEASEITESLLAIEGNDNAFFNDFTTSRPVEDVEDLIDSGNFIPSGDKDLIEYQDKEARIARVGLLIRMAKAEGKDTSPQAIKSYWDKMNAANAETDKFDNQYHTENREKIEGEREDTLFSKAYDAIYSVFSPLLRSDVPVRANDFRTAVLGSESNQVGAAPAGDQYQFNSEEGALAARQLIALRDYERSSKYGAEFVELAKKGDTSWMMANPLMYYAYLKSTTPEQQAEVNKYIPTTRKWLQAGANMLPALTGAGALPAFIAVTEAQLKDTSPDVYNGIMLTTVLTAGLGGAAGAARPLIGGAKSLGVQVGSAIAQTGGSYYFNKESYMNPDGTVNYGLLAPDLLVDLTMMGVTPPSFKGLKAERDFKNNPEPVKGVNMVVTNAETGKSAMFVENPSTKVLEFMPVADAEVVKWRESNAPVEGKPPRQWIEQKVDPLVFDNLVKDGSQGMGAKFKYLAFGIKDNVVLNQERLAANKRPDVQSDLGKSVFNESGDLEKIKTNVYLGQKINALDEDRSFTLLQLIDEYKAPLNKNTNLIQANPSALKTIDGLIAEGVLKEDSNGNIKSTPITRLTLEKYNTAIEGFDTRLSKDRDTFGEGKELDLTGRKSTGDEFQITDFNFQYTPKDISSMGERKKSALSLAVLKGDVIFDKEVGTLTGKKYEVPEAPIVKVDAAPTTRETTVATTKIKSDTEVSRKNLKQEDYHFSNDRPVGDQFILRNSKTGEISIMNRGQNKLFSDTRNSSHLKNRTLSSIQKLVDSGEYQTGKLKANDAPLPSRQSAVEVSGRNVLPEDVHVTNKVNYDSRNGDVQITPSLKVSASDAVWNKDSALHFEVDPEDSSLFVANNVMVEAFGYLGGTQDKSSGLTHTTNWFKKATDKLLDPESIKILGLDDGEVSVLKNFRKELEGNSEHSLSLVKFNPDELDYRSLRVTVPHEKVHTTLANAFKSKLLPPQVYAKALSTKSAQLLQNADTASRLGESDFAHEVLAYATSDRDLGLFGVDTPEKRDAYFETYKNLLEGLDNHFGKDLSSKIKDLADPEVLKAISEYDKSQSTAGRLTDSQDRGATSPEEEVVRTKGLGQGSGIKTIKAERYTPTGAFDSYTNRPSAESRNRIGGKRTFNFFVAREDGTYFRERNFSLSNLLPFKFAGDFNLLDMASDAEVSADYSRMPFDEFQKKYEDQGYHGFFSSRADLPDDYRYRMAIFDNDVTRAVLTGDQNALAMKALERINSDPAIKEWTKDKPLVTHDNGSLLYHARTIRSYMTQPEVYKNGFKYLASNTYEFLSTSTSPETAFSFADSMYGDSKPIMYPLIARGKVWDYENPTHRQELGDYVQKLADEHPLEEHFKLTEDKLNLEGTELPSTVPYSKLIGYYNSHEHIPESFKYLGEFEAPFGTWHIAEDDGIFLANLKRGDIPTHDGWEYPHSSESLDALIEIINKESEAEVRKIGNPLLDTYSLERLLDVHSLADGEYDPIESRVALKFFRESGYDVFTTHEFSKNYHILDSKNIRSPFAAFKDFDTEDILAMRQAAPITELSVRDAEEYAYRRNLDSLMTAADDVDIKLSGNSAIKLYEKGVIGEKNFYANLGRNFLGLIDAGADWMTLNDAKYAFWKKYSSDETKTLPKSELGEKFTRLMRSATERRTMGQVDPELRKYFEQDLIDEISTDTPLAMREATVSDEGFYSATEEAILQADKKNKLPKSASGADWLNKLRSLTYDDNGVQRGLKQSELEWMSVDVWLEEGGKRTKEEVINFVKSANVQVKQKQYGGDNGVVSPEITEAKEKLAKAQMEIDSMRVKKGEMTRDFLNAALEDPKIPDPQYYAYEAYRKTEHGKKFLELDYQVSDLKTFLAYSNKDKPMWTSLTLGGPRSNDVEIALTMHNLDRGVATGPAKGGKIYEAEEGYESPHDYPLNTIVHIRGNDRPLVSGKNAFHIDEVQSDLHQTGKRMGYKPSKEDAIKKWKVERVPDEKSPIDFEVKISDENGNKITSFKRRIRKFEPFEIVEQSPNSAGAKKPFAVFTADNRNIMNFETRSEADKWIELSKGSFRDEGATDEQEIRSAYASKFEWGDYDSDTGHYTPDFEGVPDAPFKDTGWIELAFKKALRYAVENGKEVITWTTGLQQIDRNKTAIRKQVEKIAYNVKLPATKEVLDYRDALRVEKATLEKIDSSVEGGLKGKELDRLNKVKILWEESQEDYLKKYKFDDGPDYTDGQVVLKPTAILDITDKEGNVQRLKVPLEGKTSFQGREVTLDSLIGKKMADEIRENGTGVIQEEGLTIGGGLHKFVYDNFLPTYAKKFGKQFGAKVYKEQVSTNSDHAKEIDSHGNPDNWRIEEYKNEFAVSGIEWHVYDNEGYLVERLPSKERAEGFVRKYQDPINQDVWALPITDKMRESVEMGQPLFMKAPQKAQEAHVNRLVDTPEERQETLMKKYYSTPADKQTVEGATNIIKSGFFSNLSGVRTGMSPEEAVKANNALRKDLENYGLKVVPAKGVYSGVAEDSFMVYYPNNFSSRVVQVFANKYGQESALHGAGGKFWLEFGDGSKVEAEEVEITKNNKSTDTDGTYIELPDGNIRYSMPFDFGKEIPAPSNYSLKNAEVKIAAREKYKNSTILTPEDIQKALETGTIVDARGNVLDPNTVTDSVGRIVGKLEVDESGRKFMTVKNKPVYFIDGVGKTAKEIYYATGARRDVVGSTAFFQEISQLGIPKPLDKSDREAYNIERAELLNRHIEGVLDNYYEANPDDFGSAWYGERADEFARRVGRTVEDVNNDVVKLWLWLTTAVTSPNTYVEQNANYGMNSIASIVRFYETGELTIPKFQYNNDGSYSVKEDGTPKKLGLASPAMEKLDMLGNGYIPAKTSEGKSLEAEGGKLVTARDILPDATDRSNPYVFSPTAKAMMDKHGSLQGILNFLLSPSVDKKKFNKAVDLLGDKVGAFFSNLAGQTQIPTIDTWMNRYFMALTGDAVEVTRNKKGEIEKIVDKAAKFDEKEGDFFRGVIQKATEDYNEKAGKKLSSADVQAVIWTQIKSLYNSLTNLESDNIDFTDAYDQIVARAEKTQGSLFADPDRVREIPAAPTNKELIKDADKKAPLVERLTESDWGGKYNTRYFIDKDETGALAMKSADDKLKKDYDIDTSEPELKSAEFEAWIDVANRVIQNSVLSDAEVAEIKRLSDKGDSTALAKYVVNLNKQSVAELLANVWRVNPLIGVKNILKNTAGNGFHQAITEVSRTPAFIFDIGLNELNKRFGDNTDNTRTVLAPSASSLAKGAFAGVVRGLPEAKQTFLKGSGDATFENPSFFRDRTTGISVLKPLELFTKYGFRLQEAADKPFKASAYYRSLDEQAKITLKSMPKGSTLEEAYSEMTIANYDKAYLDSLFLTFQSENKIAGEYYKYRERLSPLLKAALDTQVKYVKTPLNIVSRTLDYTGFFPLLKLAHKNFGHGEWSDFKANVSKMLDNPEDRAAISWGLGKGAVGWTLSYVGYTLAMQGAMTAIFDKEDRKEREIQGARGMSYGSMVIGDYSFDISSMTPVSFLILSGATYADEHKEYLRKLDEAAGDEAKTQEVMDSSQTGATIVRSLKALALQTPIFSQALNLWENSANKTRVINSMIGANAFLPAVVGEVARTADGKERVVENTRVGSNTFDTVKSMIPTLEITKKIGTGLEETGVYGVSGLGDMLQGREDLPVRYDMLGREIEAPLGFDPLKTKAVKSDPLLSDMEKFNITVTDSTKGTAVDRNEAKKNKGQYFEPILRGVIETEDYKQAEDSTKKKILEDVIRYVSPEFKNDKLKPEEEIFNVSLIVKREAFTKDLLKNPEKYSLTNRILKDEDVLRNASKIGMRELNVSDMLSDIKKDGDKKDGLQEFIKDQFSHNLMVNKNTSLDEATKSYNEFLADPELAVIKWYLRNKEYKERQPRLKARREELIKSGKSDAEINAIMAKDRISIRKRNESNKVGALPVIGLGNSSAPQKAVRLTDQEITDMGGEVSLGDEGDFFYEDYMPEFITKWGNQRQSDNVVDVRKGTVLYSTISALENKDSKALQNSLEKLDLDKLTGGEKRHLAVEIASKMKTMNWVSRLMMGSKLSSKIEELHNKLQ